MKPVHAHALMASRRAEQAASRAAVELRARRHRATETARKARDVLRDAVTACGLPESQGIAILAAAESLAKARSIELVTIAESSEPEPERLPGGAE